MAALPRSPLGSVGQPSQRFVVRGRKRTIGSIARSQHGPSELRLGVYPQRDAVRVAPGGELDLANVATLQAQLDELREAGFRHVVLDLRDLTFIDSSGVRLILTEDRIARRDGRRFSLIRGTPAVQRTLDLCGVSVPLDAADRGPAPAAARRTPPLPSGRSRAIAFQAYTAQLRQQGRAANRPSLRSARTEAR